MRVGAGYLGSFQVKRSHGRERAFCLQRTFRGQRADQR